MQNEMRDRLIEIIGDLPFSAEYDGYNSFEWAEHFADHLIAHGVTVQEWVSVDDRLPNDNDRVIAFRPNEPETSAYKYCVMWGWSVKASLKHRGITHWRPLPQPPKGE